MDNLTNLSVEWMRMPARNAASDSTDLVVYNPAALVHLGDGFHFNLGNQTLLRKPKHTYDLQFGAGDVLSPRTASILSCPISTPPIPGINGRSTAACISPAAAPWQTTRLGH